MRTPFYVYAYAKNALFDTKHLPQNDIAIYKFFLINHLIHLGIFATPSFKPF